MERSPLEPVESPSEPIPFAPALPRRSRRHAVAARIHPFLLPLTLVTLTIAGAFWEDRLHTLADLLDSGVWLSGLPFALCVIAILGAHEMGHYVACRLHGISATLPFFLPSIPPFGTFGAVIRIRSPIPDRRALFDVAAAGPLAGFLVALPVLIVGILTATPAASVPEGTGQFLLGSSALMWILERIFAPPGTVLEVGSVFIAGWFGLLVTSLNLFPVGQLDGGHAMYSVSRTLHRPTSRLTIVAVIAFVLVDSASRLAVCPYTLWSVVLLVLRDRHPRLLDEAQPLGRTRVGIAIALAAVLVLSLIPWPFPLT